MKSIIYITACIILLASCQKVNAPEEPKESKTTEHNKRGPHKQFGDYWYQGKAELSTYILNQARYGAMHPGEATLIFVTEPFSKSKHVKLDYIQDQEDKVTVLKLNKTKRFNTGIYPYTLMNSTFSPVEMAQYPYALKSATTVQEWCGHVYSQYDFRESGYQWRSFSYFESEGEQDQQIGQHWLEDAIWTTIRINPKNLPTGKLTMVPSSWFSRLKHKTVKGYTVNASLKSEGEDNIYSLTYPELNRSISIRFSNKAPFEIAGWEESYPDGSGMMTTTATLNKRIMSAYWNKNSPSDASLRKELGL